MSFPPNVQPVRIVAWNIQQGGSKDVSGYTRLLSTWAPDICILSEFCATESSAVIRAYLHDLGLTYSLSTVQDGDHWQRYGLLVAARWPLTPLSLVLDGMPSQRWLAVRVERETSLLLGAVHVPNRGEFEGVKYQCLDALVTLASEHAAEPMMIIGDFNTGRREIDEQGRYFDQREDVFMRTMEETGWASAFRLLHGDARQYSYWNSQTGNGFRIDHAFVAPPLAPKVVACVLAHDSPGWPSDHAALLVNLQR